MSDGERKKQVISPEQKERWAARKRKVRGMERRVIDRFLEWRAASVGDSEAERDARWVVALGALDRLINERKHGKGLVKKR